MTNIALVDDESNILTSVSLALETEGFNVDTFNNGEEAIQGLEIKKYDLGLFDIKMPRMNGNELLIKDHKRSQLVIQTLEKVSTIVANSKFTVNLVKNLIPNKDNIKYVYPGAIDLNKVKSDSFIEIKGSPVLITLARLEKRKGHKAILKAVKELTSNFPKIQYIIAGEGPEKIYLQQLVKKYSLESNVFFTGFVNESQKKYLFEYVDLMVMPTLDEREKRSIEGFGIAYLEAAFFGIPSIASDVGGAKEAVLHNKTGIIINNIDDIYQSIHDLLINPNQRKKLGSRARKRALEDFNWDIVTKKYLDAINN